MRRKKRANLHKSAQPSGLTFAASGARSAVPTPRAAAMARQVNVRHAGSGSLRFE